jgi:hypothetical protein
MVGQKVMLEWLSQLAPTTTQVGWQTTQIRTHLELEIELEKQKSCKSDAIPATHAVDGVALAYSQFVSYQAFQSATSHGHYWVSRRQLHLMVPAKKGVHRKYSGTITQHGFRKGDYVKAEMARRVYYGWVSGDTKTQVSVSDLNWKRLGQFAKSKIQLIRRATGLVVTGAKAPVSVSSRL